MTVRSLEDNTLWDGVFHLSTWVFVTGGIFVLWVVLSAGYRVGWRSLVGLLLAGWGVFNLVEGTVDHYILTVHHVRDDVSDPAWWDLGFLACGAALVAVGVVLRRSDSDDADGRIYDVPDVGDGDVREDRVAVGGNPAGQGGPASKRR